MNSLNRDSKPKMNIPNLLKEQREEIGRQLCNEPGYLFGIPSVQQKQRIMDLLEQSQTNLIKAVVEELRGVFKERESFEYPKITQKMKPEEHNEAAVKTFAYHEVQTRNKTKDGLLQDFNIKAKSLINDIEK